MDPSARRTNIFASRDSSCLYEYELEVLKETEIIETTVTNYVDSPRRLFPLYVTARYLKGIESRTISGSFGGSLFEKIKIGLATQVLYNKEEVIFQLGLELGLEL